MYHSMVGVTDYVWVNDVVLTSAARLLFVYIFCSLNGSVLKKLWEYLARRRILAMPRKTRNQAQIFTSLSPVRSSMAGIGCSIKNCRRAGDSDYKVMRR